MVLDRGLRVKRVRRVSANKASLASAPCRCRGYHLLAYHGNWWTSRTGRISVRRAHLNPVRDGLIPILWDCPFLPSGFGREHRLQTVGQMQPGLRGEIRVERANKSPGSTGED